MSAVFRLPTILKKRPLSTEILTENRISCVCLFAVVCFQLRDTCEIYKNKLFSKYMTTRNKSIVLLCIAILSLQLLNYCNSTQCTINTITIMFSDPNSQPKPSLCYWRRQMLCFSANNKQSFDILHIWIDQIQVIDGSIMVLFYRLLLCCMLSKMVKSMNGRESR